MRVGGAPSQFDLPPLTPLYIAGWGRLQLGVPHWATSVYYCKQLIIDPTFCAWQQILHWEAPGHRRLYNYLFLFSFYLAISQKRRSYLILISISIHLRNSIFVPQNIRIQLYVITISVFNLNMRFTLKLLHEKKCFFPEARFTERAFNLQCFTEGWNHHYKASHSFAIHLFLASCPGLIACPHVQVRLHAHTSKFDCLPT